MNTPSEFAIQNAARAWTFPETADIEMDVRLATAFARIIDEIKPPVRENISGVGRPSKAVVVWEGTPLTGPTTQYPSVTSAAAGMGVTPGSVSAALARLAEHLPTVPFPFAVVRGYTIARADDYHRAMADNVRVD